MTHLKRAVLEEARTHGYKLREEQPNIGLLIFEKLGLDAEVIQVNVYVTTMTVATIVTHPKRGRQHLYRRNVSLELLRRIFKNPRVHTGKGYFAQERAKIWGW